ncbi:MAG: hypothetical protein MUE44_04410 [Oscillatoriaceae cyanobacterium Prado104]|nr:hypothetical protein [Oscillatoriaceae cyanobacterium Prado104]
MSFYLSVTNYPSISNSIDRTQYIGQNTCQDTALYFGVNLTHFFTLR